jgi:hypothetical protein
MGSSQQRAAGRGRGAVWPLAHADGREHVSGSTRIDIAGQEPGPRKQLGLRAAGRDWSEPRGPLTVARAAERGRGREAGAVEALGEEGAEGGGDQGRGFFGEEVAGAQGLAVDVDGVFLPDTERVIAAADETLAAP